MPNGAGVRLTGYDYSTPNQYFITTVIEGRRPLLGAVQGTAFVSSELGRLVVAAWEETLQARPWVTADTMQVMPDHVHAIIGWNEVPSGRPATLGRFVGQFKGIASRNCHETGSLPSWDRVWQPGFWDRVIRSEHELQRIREYVVRNPQKLLVRQQHLASIARRAIRGNEAQR